MAQGNKEGVKPKPEFKLEDEFTKEITDSPIKKFEHQLISWIGSWVFLVVNLVWFIVWIVLDLHYDWLTFWVSLEAIVLAILILINENRELESDRKRAIKTYKVDISIAKKLKSIEEELREIKRHLNIS